MDQCCPESIGRPVAQLAIGFERVNDHLPMPDVSDQLRSAPGNGVEDAKHECRRDYSP